MPWVRDGRRVGVTLEIAPNPTAGPTRYTMEKTEKVEPTSIRISRWLLLEGQNSQGGFGDRRREPGIVQRWQQPARRCLLNDGVYGGQARREGHWTTGP